MKAKEKIAGPSGPDEKRRESTAISSPLPILT